MDFWLSPYYYEKNGELKGICIEILDNIASSLGMEVIFKKLPWKRMLLSAKMGEVDAVMPLFMTSDRQQYLECLSFQKNKGACHNVRQTPSFFFTIGKNWFLLWR